MRVVIGGAYNGKRKYVKEYYEQKGHQKLHYYEGEIPTQNYTKKDVIIISNFENIISQFSYLDELEIALKIVTELKKIDAQSNLVCICTDIGRGIVPLEKQSRKLRDTCGRLYQQLFNESESVIRIWYGIPQVLKGEKW